MWSAGSKKCRQRREDGATVERYEVVVHRGHAETGGLHK
jgi:hypothetical protein